MKDCPGWHPNVAPEDEPRLLAAVGVERADLPDYDCCCHLATALSGWVQEAPRFELPHRGAVEASRRVLVGHAGDALCLFIELVKSGVTLQVALGFIESDLVTGHSREEA